uniref:NADH-ubiquinone oxidoreductase chain 6 n=1 Tax=Spatula clypeata TaxID=75838 RepID=A0A0U2NF27_SPACL|nr:NADH dehydrogenase subunit 6 [Spatula clypeata]ALJ93681.1 NADH dehydrogenase subunit 6 [Spatula clypeata]
MTYFVFFLGICFVVGVLGVASNPSPYYGVVGLVLASVAGCGWLLSLGVSFVALVLFMVYLGGMLVVFVYSVALAVEPFPEAWGDWRAAGYAAALAGVVLGGLVLGGLIGSWGFGVVTVDSVGMFAVLLDFSGVAMLYSRGVGMFLVAGWGLLLTLFVVLELVRGLSQGAIRAV